MAVLQGELLDLVRKDRARRSRRERLGKFATNLLGSLLGNALQAFLQGWMFMLGVGVVHAEWWSSVPTIGYWWAVLVVYLLKGVFSATQSKAKGKD